MSAGASLPLSCEQHDYFGLERHGYGAIPVCSRITGVLDVGALNAAAQYVMDRHEPLRMRLHHGPEGVRQTFAPPGLTDAVWAPPQKDELGLLDPWLCTDLDRGRDGAVRLQLLRERRNQTLALAMLDHMACDAWGAQLFLRELWTAYRAISDGRQPEFPPLDYCYSDYICEQQARGAGPAHVADHWLAYAKRYADARTGLRQMGPPEPGAGRADLTTIVPTISVQRAKMLAVQLNVSVNSLPLACLVLAAWSMTDSDSVGVSFVYAGRETARVRPLIGAFHRTLPLLAEDIRTRTLGQFVSEIAATMFQAMSMSRAPYSARGFDSMVNNCRDTPDVGILYNQVPTTFGRPVSGKPLRLGGRTLVEFISPHFWPCRWHQYAEPRLRFVVGGGSSPTLRVIFNEAVVSKQEAHVLLNRTAALLETISDSSPESPIPAFVRLALANTTNGHT